jgi:predicted PurR-regulated permease PerM
VAERGYVTDPKSWGEAIRDVGPSYGVIFALLGMFAYLAFAGVPAINSMTLAIQDSTTAAAKRQEQILNWQNTQTQLQVVSTQNQTKIVEDQQEIIMQHGQMIDLMRGWSVQIDDLMADKKARDARATLRGER